MLGQDSINAISDALTPKVFDISQMAEEVVLADGGMEIMQRTQTIGPVWLFVYLFVLLGFFAWIRIYYGNILVQTIQASTNFQVASRMFQDNSLLQSQLDNILYAFYFLSMAFLLYLGEGRYQFQPYGLKDGQLYLFNLALLVSIFFGRIVLVIMTGFLFNRIKIFKEYLYNAFIFNKLMGLATLPLLLFVVYATGVLQEVFFWLTLSVVILVLILRLIRALIFSFKKDVSIFYMFLYLCALEITPLALLYRWLEGIL